MKTERSQSPVGNDADPRPYVAMSSPPSAIPALVRIGSANDVFDQLSDIHGEDREQFVVFALNVRHGVIARRIVHIGTLTGVEVHPREIFKGAIVNSAAAVIVAHNHPSQVMQSPPLCGAGPRPRRGEADHVHIITGPPPFHRSVSPRWPGTRG